jgi:hypothetical protein
MLAVLTVFRRWLVSDFDEKAWITPGETAMNTLTKPSAQVASQVDGGPSTAVASRLDSLSGSDKIARRDRWPQTRRELFAGISLETALEDNQDSSSGNHDRRREAPQGGW